MSFLRQTSLTEGQTPATAHEQVAVCPSPTSLSHHIGARPEDTRMLRHMARRHPLSDVM